MTYDLKFKIFNSHKDRITKSINSIRDLALNRHKLGLVDFNHTGDVALFIGYLASVSSDDNLKKSAEAIINDAIAQTPDFERASLYGGYASTAHSAELLRKHLFKSSIDINKNIDEALIENIDSIYHNEGHDLISGITGIGIYALERVEFKSGKKLLNAVINKLHETAITKSERIAWKTKTEWMAPADISRYPNGNFNLGLSHGIAGTINLLAHASKLNIKSANTLLNGSLEFLLNSIDTTKNRQCMFPIMTSDMNYKNILPDSKNPRWCYGDLGTSVSLYNVGKLIGSTSICEVASMTGHCASKNNKEAIIDKSTSKDADIDFKFDHDWIVCHGHIGNAHLFRWLHAIEGKERFLTESINSLEAYFKAEEDPRFNNNSNDILEGISGAGAALTSLITDTDPWWDRRLALY